MRLFLPRKIAVRLADKWPVLLDTQHVSTDPFAQAAFYAMLYACGHLKGEDSLEETFRQMPDEGDFSVPITVYILNFTECSLAAAALRKVKPKTGDDIMRTAAEEFRAEGEAKGRVEMLTQQLRHRFGTVPLAVQGHLAQASAKELGEWSTRLFDAESLEAVFDNESRH